jgi:hypothetical protein
MNAMRLKKRVYRSMQKHPGLKRFLKDPFIHGEICGIVEDAELMGMDLNDPELMGGLIANVVKKIATAVRKRRAKKASSGQSTIPQFTMQTSQGTAALGPGGLTWTGQQSIPIGNTGMALQTMPQSETIMDKIKNNPALLAIPAGGIVLFMMMSKRKEKK